MLQTQLHPEPLGHRGPTSPMAQRSGWLNWCRWSEASTADRIQKRGYKSSCGDSNQDLSQQWTFFFLSCSSSAKQQWTNSYDRLTQTRIGKCLIFRAGTLRWLTGGLSFMSHPKDRRQQNIHGNTNSPTWIFQSRIRTCNLSVTSPTPSWPLGHRVPYRFQREVGPQWPRGSWWSNTLLNKLEDGSKM